MPIASSLVKDFAENASKELKPYIRSIGHSLSQTEEGRDVAGLLTKYRMNSDKIFTGLHQDATNKVATGALKEMPPSHELLSSARTAARTHTFGSNDAQLTFLARMSHQNNGHIATQNLMDNVAMYLHEDTKLGTHEHESMFKTQANKAIEKSDPRYKKAAAVAKAKEIPLSQAMQEEGIDFYNTSSDYRHVTPMERYATNFIYSRFSPLIAIPHLGTILNTVQSTQTSSLVKALGDFATGNMAEMKKRHIASGLVAESSLRGMRAIEDARNGVLVRYAPKSFQNVVSKVTSTPGFNYVRDWQINFTGAATYHSAIDYADKFARDTEDARYAKARLEQYGMTSTDLAAIKSTGELTEDQMQRAVWNGVNKKIFLETSMNRAYNAQKDPFHRAVTMYHGYISSQAKFMGEEMKLNFGKDTRNIASIAKSVAVMGVIFPAAGEALKMLEMVGRGQWNSISAESNHDYEAMSFAKEEGVAAHARDFAGVYLDAMAHLGAFGIAFELIQGAQRGYLQSQMAGALLGTGIKYSEDVVRTGTAAIEGKMTDYDSTMKQTKAIRRDALEASLPLGLGRYAKHALVPTKKEEEEAKGGSHKLKRLKVKGGLKKMTFN